MTKYTLHVTMMFVLTINVTQTSWYHVIILKLFCLKCLENVFQITGMIVFRLSPETNQILAKNVFKSSS